MKESPEKSNRSTILKVLSIGLALAAVFWLILGWYVFGAAGKLQQAAAEKQEARTLPPVRTQSAQNRALYYCRRTLAGPEAEAYDRICQAVEAHETTLKTKNVPAERLFELYQLVLWDHPEYFWCDGRVSASMPEDDPEQLCELSLTYTMDTKSAEQIRALITERASPILAELSGRTDYEKVRGVYEYVIGSTVYEEQSSDQTMISVFLKGRGLCAGYARTVQYLLQRLGVETLYVSGTAMGESHSWNMVRIEGEYYEVDATWGDPVTDTGEQTIRYEFLCATSEELRRTHHREMDLIQLPECTQLKYNYFNQEHRLFSTYQPESIYALLAQAFGAQTPLYIKFTNDSAYYEATTDLFENGTIEQMLERYCAERGLDAVWYCWNVNDELFSFSIEQTTQPPGENAG